MPYQGRCSLCREVRLVVRNCCNNCYLKHFVPRWRWAGCGQMRRASYVVDAEAGTRLCPNCYKAQIHTATCSRCGKANATIHHRTARRKPVCTEYYHLHFQRPRRAGREGPTDHQLAALAEMKTIASERGGWCLSDRYEDSQLPLRWRCRNKHEWGAKPVSVKQPAAAAHQIDSVMHRLVEALLIMASLGVDHDEREVGMQDRHLVVIRVEVQHRVAQTLAGVFGPPLAEVPPTEQPLESGRRDPLD